MESSLNMTENYMEFEEESDEPSLTFLDLEIVPLECTEKQKRLHLAASTGDTRKLKSILRNCSPDDLEAKNDLHRTVLMTSIYHNDVKSAQILIKHGARVNNCDILGNTALHMSIVMEHYNCVELLLSNDALWYQTDNEGVCALHMAAAQNCPKILSLILNHLKPGEVDMQDRIKRTALHWCSAYGNTEHTILLLKKGANLCILDSTGKLPLHWAAGSLNRDAVNCFKCLLKEQPSAINWTDYDGHTPLHLAIYAGTIEMVDYLTSNEDCIIDNLDNRYRTPLHLAVLQDQMEKIYLILSRCPMYGTTDVNGATAMHYAAYHNKVTAIKIFLLHKYLKDEADYKGLTAFIWAVIKRADDVVKFMLKFGADVNYKASHGTTALHFAAECGHVSTAELLISYKPTIDCKDNHGRTPLLRACQCGHYKLVLFLIENGASLATEDRYGRTCIHWVAWKGFTYICTILISRKADFNVRDKMGFSPLHYAAGKNHAALLTVLLESGANPNIADKEGKTPLHIAVLRSSFHCLELLIKHRAFGNSLVKFENEWASALDIAVKNENSPIADLLREKKVLSLAQMKTIAAKKIQKWYRDIHTKQNQNAKGVLSEEEQLGVTMQQSTLHLDKATQVYLADWNGETTQCCACMNSRCVKCNSAAAIIQTFWYKHFVRKKITTMRFNIMDLFDNMDKRKVAEQKWQDSTKVFFV